MTSPTTQVIRFEISGTVIELSVPSGTSSRCLVSTGTQTDTIASALVSELATGPPRPPSTDLLGQMRELIDFEAQACARDDVHSASSPHRSPSPLFTAITKRNEGLALPSKAPTPIVLPPLPVMPTRKRKFTVAPPSAHVKLPEAGTKRIRQSTSLIPTQPRPFPMDIPRELEFRANLQAEKLLDPLPTNMPPPPKEDKTTTRLGDFVLIQAESGGLFYPYEACKRVQSGFEMRLYKGIASGSPAPVLHKSFFDIMMVEDKHLKVHQVVKLYWPSDDVPSSADDYPLPLWYSDYKPYIMQHLVAPPPNSPFRSLIDDWSSFISRPRHLTSEDHFKFAQTAMLSSTRSHVNTVLSFSDQQRIERAGEELLKDLVSAGSYTPSLIPTLVSGPGSIIIAFAQLAVNLNLTVPQTVAHFVAGHIVQADRRRERVWQCYLRHLEHGKMIDEELKRHVLVADTAAQFVHIVE